MVACHLPGENCQFLFHCNLAEEIADAENHQPDKDRLAVLQDPNQVDLEVLFAVRPTPVDWHATLLPHPGTRLKATVSTIPQAENKYLRIVLATSPAHCQAGRRLALPIIPTPPLLPA